MNTLKKVRISKFKMLLLLFPPLYSLHDIEEILTVEQFLEEHSSIIPFSITTLEFSFAFILLWIVASIGCYQAYVGKKFIGMAPATYLAFLVPGILLANGIGHLLQLIFFKEYVPGIITSIIILYPYSFITAKHLIAEGVVTYKRLFVYFILGFIIQAPLAFIALYIAQLVL
ncbi:HXXEE domain-containing protein [Lysinibacillus sp. BW-2-10]|uniref:HXXEE domain-containing protein n=1 Tax=Lysinibacillus sp. BW-2-10 TaxID=2590030 RepID=UPI00117D480A|nr:HXXEE domain-containing protein [Lysinibacillus sp. BW-2-10]TSI02585.1 HXXEE domain-containing protein [Lysinibacillus sp. BW-2-10]